MLVCQVPDKGFSVENPGCYEVSKGYCNMRLKVFHSSSIIVSSHAMYSLIFLLTTLLPLLSAEAEKMKIRMIPQEFRRTPAGESLSLRLTVSADKDSDEEEEDYYIYYSDEGDSSSSSKKEEDDLEEMEVALKPRWRNNTKPFVFNLSVDNPSIVHLNTNALEMTVTELHKTLALGTSINKSLEVKSRFFGYYYLDIELSRDGKDYGVVVQDYELVFTRTEDPLVNTFIIILTVSVMAVTVIIGCALNIDVIKGVFWHPIGPAVGFFSQFLFMPLVSFGIGYALLPHHLHRLGLFALGTCPGGVYSNLWAVLFSADLNLSITMTYISTIAAIGMMPLWLFTLGRQIFPDEDLGEITIPYVDLVISLVGMTVSLAVGVLIQSKRKKWAEFLKSTVIKPLIFFLLFFIILVHLYNVHHLFFLLSWRLFVCGCVVVGGGYVFGAGLSYACGLDRRQIIAVTLETSLQNSSIAFVLLKLSLPEPENDIAILACASQLLVTGPPLFIIYTLLLMYRKFRRFKNPLRHKNETCEEMQDVKNEEAPKSGTQLVATEVEEQTAPVEREIRAPMVSQEDATGISKTESGAT